MSAVKFLAFSCPHAPLHDPLAVDFLIEQIQEFRPDVIVGLGDWFEAEAASRFGSEHGLDLIEEFRSVRDLLKRIREASPWIKPKKTEWSLDPDSGLKYPIRDFGDHSRRVFLLGNHDENILAWNRLEKNIRDLCDFRRHEILRAELSHWVQFGEYKYSRSNVYRLGQVSFAHGWEAGVRADENQAFNLGTPFGLGVWGHTHKPRKPTQAEVRQIPVPYWFANAGTLRDLNSAHYMNRNKRVKWGQAVVVGEAALWRYDKSMMPQSKEWDAETRILRMFEQAA